jgi:LPXTG-site transpeptidase (sortase) family protein
MSTKAEKNQDPKLNPKSNDRGWILTALGIALAAMSLALLSLIFYPILKSEINYRTHKNKFQKHAEILSENANDNGGEPEPIDTEFSVIIPKIGINSQLIADVNSEDPREYQKKLAEGVAHARGSARPGEGGDIFLFAHSGANFEEALRFNAVFYLLNKLETEDEIFIFYQGKKYAYQVFEKKVVNSEELRYNNPSDDPRLILMTCWPPGTTWKRLIVTAHEYEN